MKRAIVPLAIIVMSAAALAAGQATPAPPAPPAAPAPAPRTVAPAAPSAHSYSYSVSSSRPYLGVDVRDVTEDRMAALKLKEERGVEVTMVDRDAPAGKAGLKEHDVILSFNGDKVDDADDLREKIRDTSAGKKVTLGISRDGKPMNIDVTMTTRGESYKVTTVSPRVHVVVPPVHVRIPEIQIPSFTMLQYSRSNGLVVEDLTPQLGEYFAAKNGEGVLVRSVEKGSKGEAAGLRAGDVILKLAGERVTCTDDWNRLLRDHAKASVPVTVLREKREQTLTLAIPEREYGYNFDTPEYNFDFTELNRIGPEINREMRELQSNLAREMAERQKEWQKERQEMRKQMQEELREQQRELRKQQEELRKQQRELEKQLKEQDKDDD